MKKIIKIPLIIIGILFLAYLAGFLLPRKVQVERTAIINASPEAVYSLINNLTTYDKWMPWNQLDPTWKVEYATQKVGAGAWYKWDSKNSSVGKGKLTIDQSIPNEKIITKLEFEGFSEPSMGGFLLKPAGNGTEVKWYMESDMGNNPGYRWMGLMMNKLLGAQFEKGLQNIEALAGKSELKR